MRHNYLKNDSQSCSHWAVRNNNGQVWVQLGDENGDTIKLAFTPEQAEAFATQLFNSLHNTEPKASIVNKHEDFFVTDTMNTSQNDFTKAWEQRLADPENSILLSDEPLTPEQVHERLNKMMSDLAQDSEPEHN